jgi:hypothetical protein
VTQLDERIIRAKIEIDGQLKVFESPLWIESAGTKYANPIQNEAEIRIGNLSKADRDYLLTETSPFNKNATPKKIILEAGRVSTGTSIIYEGDITACKPTQPPDIILSLKSQTGQFLKGQIVSSEQPGSVSLSRLAQQVANDLGLSLRFEAKDKNIANYSFTGGTLKQVDKLGSVGAVSAYVDDNELVVKDIDLPLQGVQRILNEQSGMIGIPEITEQGVKVTMLLDNQTKLGGALKIDSVIYPTINGQYVIYKLGWVISSRDVPFYWVAEAKRVGYNRNSQSTAGTDG